MARWFPERASSWLSLPADESVRLRGRQKQEISAPRKISLKPQIIDFMLLMRFVNEGSPANEPSSRMGHAGTRCAAGQPDRGRLPAAARRHYQRDAGALGEAADRASAPTLRHGCERAA